MHSEVHKNWQRDFYYDTNALTITPPDEQDSSKTMLIAQLRELKEKDEIPGHDSKAICGIPNTHLVILRAVWESYL
jgi:hypothetical protein